MISNTTKQKLVNSFNQVVTSIHNLRADIASEGKKAFMNGDEQDIKELASLIGKLSDLEGKLDKISPLFKTYALDIATETHPSEFPLEPMSTNHETYENAGDTTGEAEETHNKNSYINCYYHTEMANVTGRYISDKNVVLCAGSSIKWPLYGTREYNIRLEGLVASNNIDVDVQEDTRLLIIKRDITFKSVNAMLSFVRCKKTRSASSILEVEDGKTLESSIQDK